MSAPAERACSVMGCQNKLPYSPLTSIAEFAESSSPPPWRRHYEELDQNCKEIRLLRLKPGTLSDPVECTLFRTPLFTSPELPRGPPTSNYGASSDASDREDKFPWRALSYTWGEECRDPPYIRLNGDNIPVRANLHEALVWLRHHGYWHQPLWIDALCIDQANDKERQVQVSIMAEIFGYAGETIIYVPIDPESKDEQLEVERELRESVISDSQPIDYETVSNFLHRWRESDSDSPLNRALAIIMASDGFHSYWDRLWTLQECFMARSLTAISGALLVHWEVLCWMTRAAVHYDKMLPAETEDFEIQITGMDFGDGMVPCDEQLDDTMIKVPADDKSETSAVLSHGICLQLIQRQDAREKRTSSLLLETLVGPAKNLNCADHRDSVYGVLGMVAKSDKHCSSIEPDYTRCTQCVFREAAWCIIRDTQRLDLLSVADATLVGPDFPSWLPWWSSVGGAGKIDGTYRFSPDTTSDVILPGASGALKAAGFVMEMIDEYEKLDFPPVFSVGQAKKALSEFRAWLFRLLLDEAGRKKCLNDLAALVSGYSPDNERFKEHIERVCAEDVASDQDVLLEDNFEIGKAYIAIGELIHHILPVVINKGYGHPALGLFHVLNVYAGDMVCGILGCDYPLLVSRKLEGDLIIGAGWIAGYGNGEAIEELHAGKHTLETFRFI